jgi:hypothetical protein
MDRPKEGYMRRLFVGGSAVLAMLVLALVASPAMATHSNGNGPDKDFVAGSGKGPLPTPLGTFPAHYHANAWSTATGGVPAQGQWFTDIDTRGTPFEGLGTVSISGPVICISAAGNGANWRGIIEDSNQPGLAPPGFGVLTRWVDNGEGKKDPPDQQVGFLTPPPGPNPTCPPTAFSTGPNLQGNLVVHDGI